MRWPFILRVNSDHPCNYSDVGFSLRFLGLQNMGMLTIPRYIPLFPVSSTGPEELDHHPERRMKAAFASYEEANMPRLKKENPNMRLSQLKQLLKKEWMKSPENPLNQRFASYNSK